MSCRNWDGRLFHTSRTAAAKLLSPSMRFCSRLVARQEASATDAARAWYGGDWKRGSGKRESSKNAGVENAPPDCRGGKRGSGKRRSLKSMESEDFKTCARRSMKTSPHSHSYSNCFATSTSNGSRKLPSVPLGFLCATTRREQTTRWKVSTPLFDGVWRLHTQTCSLSWAT